MGYHGLRDWLDQLRSLQELVEIDGADWNLEMGAATELVLQQNQLEAKPAVLFNNVPGYPVNYRVLTNILNSIERLSLVCGFPPGLSSKEFVERWRAKSKSIDPIKPQLVSTGPVFENVLEGEAVNILTFPVPKWHELDGGRYIGTADLVITKDPNSEWVNVGTHRVMVRDANSLVCYITAGKHARIHRDRNFQKNLPCPVAISFGHDPLLFLIASLEIPYGMDEFAFCGGLKGEPINVVQGPATGLPIPADAEIVIEGEMYPGEVSAEGPFGEWPGYYASATRQEPVIQIKRIMFRNDPIITASPPFKPSTGYSLAHSLLRSSILWNALERSGVPEVKAVRCHEAAGRFLTIVSIKQRYPGHAKQALTLASQTREGAYNGRYVIVVDDDIDIYSDAEVIWALCTRSDPQRSIDILRRCWSSPVDPAIPPDQKGFNSQALIDACKPYEWLDQFPPEIHCSAQLLNQVKSKWPAIFAEN